LSRLRAETRVEHDAIERVLGLASESLTHASYLHCISRFHGFYGPVESALAAQAADSKWQSLLHGRLGKTALLERDLGNLGVRANSLPVCLALPPLGSAAELLGCLYVLEGATLGGRVISPLLHTRLGLTPVSGAGFFNGYGEATGSMWQALRGALVSAEVEAICANKMIANANATFRALRQWCQEAPSHEHDQ
jgi:heme oxygenase (biliverdin-IX-beta and delta-forming)